MFSRRDYSNYNGLQLQIEERFSRGLLFQANYVCSKTLDVRSFEPTFTTVSTGCTQSTAATPFDYHRPRARCLSGDLRTDRAEAAARAYWFLE